MYIWTCDSHECFGPFPSYQGAKAWALATNKSSFQILDRPEPGYRLQRPSYPKRILDNLRSEMLIDGQWRSNGQAQYDEIYAALGLRSTAHLPAEGVPPTRVGNVLVWVLPKTDKPQDAARTWCECPVCGKHLTTGKLQQHLPTHKS